MSSILSYRRTRSRPLDVGGDGAGLAPILSQPARLSCGAVKAATQVAGIADCLAHVASWADRKAVTRWTYPG